MSDDGFDFDTVPDDEGWTSLPTGTDDGSFGLSSDASTSLPSTATDSSGFNIDTFGKALQYGVDAFGKITAIQHSGASQYNTPPGTGITPRPSNLPATMPSAGSGATFMEKLTDFTSPVPWAVGLVTIFGVLVIAHSASGRR